MLSLQLVIGASYLLYLMFVARPTGFFTANTLFVSVQVLMAYGTFAILDPHVPADALYANIVAWSTTVYAIVSGALMLAWGGFPPRQANVGPPQIQNTGAEKLNLSVGVYAALLVAGLITVAYYFAVGYSALIVGLGASISGDELDVAGFRLESYAGERYFAPGYVNQFRIVLFPAMVALVITAWHRRGLRRWFPSVALAFMAIFGLVGTGQRGAFVQFAIVLIVFLRSGTAKISRKAQFVGGLVSVGVFSVASLALGRRSGSGGLASAVSATVVELRDRIVFDQAAAAVPGFRYIYTQPIQWGSEWVTALTGILPGSTGSDLPVRIFAYLYRSDRGTAPPAIWGSIYHNFGLVGIAVGPVLLAVIIVSISRRFAQTENLNLLAQMGRAGITVSLGMWASGSPMVLLNSGLMAWVFIWFWGVRQSKLSNGPAVQSSRPRVSAGSGVRADSDGIRDGGGDRYPEPVR